MKYYIGIDVGGTKCAASLGIEDGGGLEVLAREEFPTVGGPEQVLGRLAALAEQLARGKGISAIGVSSGGPLDSKRGVILSPPNLPGWDNVPVTRFFRERLSAPAYLENDANACALAEWQFGAGWDLSDFVFLTFGTGLGAGIVSGGRLLTGASGNAGEIGHVRLTRSGPVGYGKAGSAEGYCSGGGIARLAERLISQAAARNEQTALAKLSGAELTAKRVAEAARAGDALARKAMKISAEKLGETVSILVDVLNPQAVIVGGVYMRALGLLEADAMRVVRREALAGSLAGFRLLPAGLGERVGDYAALSVAAYGATRERQTERTDKNEE